MRELGSPSSQGLISAHSETCVAETLTWMHMGDLHITTDNQANYRPLEEIIEEANEYLADAIDFAVIPGAVAENATEAQYRLARQALDKLRVPRNRAASPPFMRRLACKHCPKR